MNALPRDLKAQIRPTPNFEPHSRPANIVAEQALLGAILINNEAIEALPFSFEASHFYEPFHRQVFDAVKRLHDSGKRANPVTVKSSVDQGGMIGGLTVAQYLAFLSGEAVSILNAPDYASAITFEAMRRGMIAVGEQSEDLGIQCVEELSFLEQAEALRDQMTRIIRGLEGDEETTLADASQRAMDATNQACQGKGEVGVDYGFAPLMALMGPAMPSHLIVVGGGTKQGKSSLIEQVVMGAAMNGHPVWIYSGEMKGEELAQRALSRITDIQAWRQARGKVSDSEYEKLETARRNAETWQRRVILKDKPMSLAQIGRSVETFSKRHHGGMVVVDHIGLVDRDKDTARLKDAEFGPIVTRTLKMLANKAGLPIFAAAQLKKNTFVNEYQTLNRKAFLQATNRRPKATDLIGACENDANHVICPFRAEPILEELKPSEGADSFGDWEAVMETVKDKAELLLALSRHTRYPQRRDVRWNGPKTQFEDLNDTGQARFL
jgi:replicative DNA helicase